MGFLMYWAIFCSHPAALQPCFSRLHNTHKDWLMLRYSGTDGLETGEDRKKEFREIKEKNLKQ